MSGLMKLCGALLLIAAIVLVLMLKLSSAQMQVLGIGPDVIATLLIGGILSLGLGGLIEAVKSQTGGMVSQVAELAASSPVIVNEIVDEKTQVKRFGFGRRKTDEPTVTVEEPSAPIIPAVAKTVAATSVADTIAALEQAKADIKIALGGVETLGSPEPEAVTQVETPTEAETPAADGELYVVEEKIIRGRPSRILSDDTVEAETDEGWMRFENLEHLNEYLDSVEEGDA